MSLAPISVKYVADGFGACSYFDNKKKESSCFACRRLNLSISSNQADGKKSHRIWLKKSRGLRKGNANINIKFETLET